MAFIDKHVNQEPDSFDVQISSPLAVGGIITADCDDASITAEVAGGNAPYTYVWSTGDTGTNVSGLVAGQVVAVVVTDSNGRYGVQSFQIPFSECCNDTSVSVN